MAGYWASLGLSPEIAEQNLGNCRVRIEAIDVKGAEELAAALSELGVRIVKRSPDLTVTLVNDYLERRLAEMNRQRVSDKIALAAGAAVRRLSAGRAGVQSGRKRLLDLPVRSHDPQPRDQGVSRPRTARPSPSRRWPATTVGQSAIQFAAVEIAKAIATGFRTDMRDHIVSLDLLGAASSSITWRAARNVRPAAARSCGTRAARRSRSSSAQAPSWS